MSSHGRSGGALIRPQHRNLISNKNHNCNAKLGVIATTAMNGQDFASLLECAIERSGRGQEMKQIEAAHASSSSPVSSSPTQGGN
jgi:hypothetical protein